MIPINATTILIAFAIIAGLLALILRHQFQKDTHKREASWSEYKSKLERIEQLKEELRELEGEVEE